MKEWTHENAQCHVLTRKDGLMAAMGHDLDIAVTRFSLKLGDDGKLTGSFDPSSLRVLGAVHGGRVDASSPSTKDRAQIEKTIREDILDVKRFPSIHAKAERVTRDAMAFDITLTLHGVTRVLRADATHTGNSAVVSVILHQPDFGITPFSAMLGALKIKPDVVVKVESASLV